MASESKLIIDGFEIGAQYYTRSARKVEVSIERDKLVGAVCNAVIFETGWNSDKTKVEYDSEGVALRVVIEGDLSEWDLMRKVKGRTT